MQEFKSDDGKSTFALACGSLNIRKRYLNAKLEQELIEFKKEVEEKFSLAETK